VGQNEEGKRESQHEGSAGNAQSRSIKLRSHSRQREKR
jgi:hypothetical protein